MNLGCVLCGAGSGLLLMVSLCVYRRYKKYLQNDAISTNLSLISTSLEDQNVKHTKEGAIMADETALDKEAV